MKNKIRTLILLFFCTILVNCTNKNGTSIPYSQALNDAVIVVENPDNILDGSLIIGNGDISALVYSDSASILMNLTKNDVWDARVETKNDPPIPTLDLIKKLGKSDTGFPIKNVNRAAVLPEGTTWPHEDSYHTNAYPCPRQCARVILTPDNASGNLHAGADLDIRKARVRMVDMDIETLAEVRALAQNNVFLINGEGSIKLEAIKSKGLPPAQSGTTDGVIWLTQSIPGDLDWPGMQFAVAAASSPSQKTVSIVTSLESENYLQEAISLALQTLEINHKKMIKEHEQIWDNFWSASGIKIENKLLQDTWYRSLYFLRCVSKPGVQSTGLYAGLVNDTPQWHGDYHTNYNIQQTYWAAFAANHTELCEPYDRLMFEYLDRAKWLAKQVYNINGAYYPHVLYAYEPANPELCKSRNGRQYIHHTWGLTIGVNGFSVQPMWWHYKYDPDIELLKNRVYPAIRETALFYADFIDQCPGDETIELGPSVSPEHHGWTKYLKYNYNCTFDISMVRYTLNAAIEGAEILNTDPNLVTRFKACLERLPDYPKYGKDSPVVVDVENAEPMLYNIPVPITPVFPSDIVTWWSSENEKQIFERTIQNMEWNGNNATIMIAVAKARLGMKDTEQWINDEILARYRPNGTMTLNRLEPHHRFNDNGHYTEQFGTGIAISELLLQSVKDIIRVFPALPDDQSASFTNLRAQGGFLVSADKSNDVDKIKITSLYGGTLKLESPWKKIQIRSSIKKNTRTYEPDQKDIIILETSKGEILECIQG